ncbi:unnamed protein product [Owenia fusiformis]|uniref:Uncharacterized protein n=1 Tax=Owenia fusiformis TaxID=6347 RepID=A0A8J1UGX7_OWEFU|nr:unnamed protein product [Owenia fusiformis]
MSGRDLKTFMNTHRGTSAEAAKLVTRITDGIHSNKYKAVDYDQLKAFAAEKKFEGQMKLSKLRKFEQISKHNKEQNLLKQHHLIWKKEFMKLNNQRKKLQAEIENLVLNNSDEYIFQSLGDYEVDLMDSFNKFKIQTAEPIWTLREDLQYWVAAHNNKLEDDASQSQHSEISVMVENVKEQQQRVLEQLENEEASLEGELLAAFPDLVQPNDKDVETGIPTEAFELECPHDDLKVKVLQEFIALDERHQDRLIDLATQHPDVVINDVPHGSWSPEDHFVYAAISEQYPSGMTNRRLYFLDRMKMHLPHKTKASVISHDQWWLQYKYYHDRRKAIIHDWLRDRKELLQKTRAVFAEACIEQEMLEVKNKHKAMQQQLCSLLYDQVSQWKDQKLEAQQLEEELLARQLEDEQEQQKVVSEREKKRRDKEKQEVLQFNKKRAEEREKAEAYSRQRLEELKALMAEQAEYDKERVKFREDQIQKKQEEIQELKEQAEGEKKLQEARLEALREQVRPNVEADPARVAQQTQAWFNRQVAEDNIVIKKPLFEVNSFTAKQIGSDARVRLESKLREAGLHNTDYARSMLKQMQPPQAPRRDMESTVFKLPKPQDNT